MKPNMIHLLPLMAVFAAASCAGTHDPSDSADGTPQAPFTLSVDKETIESDGQDAATFTITDASGLVLTDADHIRNTSFYIEELDEWHSGMGTGDAPNILTSIVDGTYTVSAMYDGKYCLNTVTVTSRNRGLYEVFHKNVAVYRLTGTWCQYCPYMTEALNNVNDFTKDHMVLLEFHNGDEFSVPYNSTTDLAGFLLSRYGTEDDGYPFCVYGAEEGSRKKTVNDIQKFVKTQLADHPARTGIRASSSVKDGKLVVDATVKASAAGEYDLGMAVLRDNCIPTSGTAYEKVYDDVVLSISGNFYAMSSDGSFSLAADQECSLQRTWESVTLLGDTSDLKVVLFTMTKDTDGSFHIDNTVSFKVGEDVEYRYNSVN